MLKKITINSHTISYRDNEANKPAIFFLHGSSLSSKIFNKQFEDKYLNSNFRLIALDLPGCGESDNATDMENTYTFIEFGKLSAELLDSLKIKECILIGFSLGGHSLVQALPKFNNAKGLMIFGAPPVNNLSDYEQAIHITIEELSAIAFKENYSEEEIDFFAKALFSPDFKDCPSFIKENLRRTDGKFRSTLAEYIYKGLFSSEIKILQNTTLPVAIMQGEMEAITKTSYLESLDLPTLWKNKIHIIEGAGHALNYEKPEIFNKVLSEFAKFCL